MTKKEREFEVYRAAVAILCAYVQSGRGAEIILQDAALWAVALLDETHEAIKVKRV